MGPILGVLNSGGGFQADYCVVRVIFRPIAALKRRFSVKKNLATLYLDINLMYRGERSLNQRVLKHSARTCTYDVRQMALIIRSAEVAFVSRQLLCLKNYSTIECYSSIVTSPLGAHISICFFHWSKQCWKSSFVREFRSVANFCFSSSIDSNQIRFKTNLVFEKRKKSQSAKLGRCGTCPSNGVLLAAK